MTVTICTLWLRSLDDDLLVGPGGPGRPLAPFSPLSPDDEQLAPSLGEKQIKQ